ncbi:MAG: stage II sporulation protein M [Clostridia bacterium]
MTEDRFIRRYQEAWKQLDDLLCSIRKKGGLKKLDFSTLEKLDRLYRQVSCHLSYAQSYFPGSQTVQYLNGLISRAHHQIYSGKKGSMRDILKYYRQDVPYTIRKNWIFLAVSFGMFMLAALFSFIYTWNEAQAAFVFLPSDMVRDLNLEKSPSIQWDNPVMSSVIMTNNIYVSLLAFAYGISLGLGTGFVLILNGLLLGSLSALAMKQGAALLYWSLILPHGVIELSAIFLSGAAGLKIGYSLIDPGPYRRRDALLIQGRESLKIMGAVIPMLVLAAIIEGFITPSGMSPILKLMFAAFTGLVMLVYFLHR